MAPFSALKFACAWAEATTASGVSPSAAASTLSDARPLSASTPNGRKSSLRSTLESASSARSLQQLGAVGEGGFGAQRAFVDTAVENSERPIARAPRHGQRSVRELRSAPSSRVLRKP